MGTADQLIDTLSKTYTVEVVKMHDTKFICLLWKEGVLKSSGIGADILEAATAALDQTD